MLSTILNKAFRKSKKVQSIDADIYTELKKAEKELRVAEGKFNHALSHDEVARAIVLIESAEKKYKYYLNLYREVRRG